MNAFKKGLLLTITLILIACGGDDGVPADPVVRDYSATFSALPTQAIYPPDNTYNQAKEALGELLFWDPILSGDQNVACASCHHPSFGWADGRTTSVGSDGVGLGPNRSGNQLTPLHSPTILNVAFTGLPNGNVPAEFVSGGYFWDLRADTLEEQAKEPIKSAVEMLGDTLSEDEIFPIIVERLKANAEYEALFAEAFESDDPINEENIVKAIATFQRRIISPNTRFDAFLQGDQSALNQQEIIGLNKFIDGGCADCHSGPMLSDNELDPEDIIINDRAVRTPSLRNLAFTAPFMHDGSRTRLIDAIAEYEDRGDIDVTIGDGDFGDIEAFLKTLDTNNFYKQVPESVPSGLPVGGDIE